MTDKDRSCTSQTRADHVLFTFIREEQLDLVMTYIFPAHLRSIQQNNVPLTVEVPCSGFILNVAAEASKAKLQHLP